MGKKRTVEGGEGAALHPDYHARPKSTAPRSRALAGHLAVDILLAGGLASENYQ